MENSVITSADPALSANSQAQSTPPSESEPIPASDAASPLADQIAPPTEPARDPQIPGHSTLSGSNASEATSDAVDGMNPASVRFGEGSEDAQKGARATLETASNESAPTISTLPPPPPAEPPPPLDSGACRDKSCPADYVMIDRGDRCTCRPRVP